MGFGWLLCGYFAATLMTLHRAGNFLRLIGWGIVLFSAKRLSRYHNAFLGMGIASILMLLLSGVLAFADVTGFLYDNLVLSRRLIGEGALVWLGYGEQVASMLFQIAMLFAVIAIAKETEVKKISDNGIRNLVFVGMYAVAYLLSLALSPTGGRVASTLAGISWILYFVCIFLNLLLIFSAYRWICDEEDAEMAEKPSRFAFVNRFREKNEEQSRRAMSEYVDYRREKLEKKREKRKKRGK
jgi:hypothetical protein